MPFGHLGGLNFANLAACEHSFKYFSLDILLFIHCSHSYINVISNMNNYVM